MNKFLLLLEEFHPDYQLVMYSHRFTIFKYEHPGIIELGQPEDVQQENGSWLGSNGLQKWIVIDGKKWTFDCKVKELIEYYERFSKEKLFS